MSPFFIAILGKMADWVIVRNRNTGRDLLRARWCDSFLCQLRGLTFRRAIPAEEGLLLVYDRASRLNSAIHMLGMWFEIGVMWLDPGGKVVDIRLAKPWRAYIPKAPAKYTLEVHPSQLGKITLGDELEFIR